MDLVMVLGKGSKWSNGEARLTLRSVEKNMTGIDRVVIVGEKPEWATDEVLHIPADDIFSPYVNADGNIIHKVLQVCKSRKVSNPFLYINDDELVLQPIDANDVPNYHGGDLQDKEPSFWLRSFWRTRLRRTMEALIAKGKTTYFYDWHLPMIMHKRKFKRAAKAMDWRTGVGLCIKTMYGNYVGVEGTDYREARVFQEMSYEGIKKKVANKPFMTFNDGGLTPAFFKWAMELFPEKSKYEKDNNFQKLSPKKIPLQVVGKTKHYNFTPRK
jgi:hypothetical protein